MVIKWASAYILIMMNAVLTETTSHWTHYEQTYTGGCKSDGNPKSSCINLGEHAYKGHILNEPPKGIKFYLDDLEPFYEDYQLLDRKKRSSKKKESKNKGRDKNQGSSDFLEDDVEEKYYDIDDEEDKIEEPIRKKVSGRKKAQKKKVDENEYEDEKNEEEDTNYEENEDVETELENKKQHFSKNKIQ